MSYENPFSIGLDLGQVNEHTALAIIEKVRSSDGTTTHFHLRRLERYRLGTTYPQMADHVATLVDAEPLTRYVTDEFLNTVKTAPLLTIDQTAVGAPVARLFKQRNLSFKAVMITASEGGTSSALSSQIPKRDLVNALLVTMQNGHLKVSKGLELWPTLREEMQNFRRKITLRATSPSEASYELWRESESDDLVLAVCLACWGAALPRGFAGTFSYRTGERVA